MYAEVEAWAGVVEQRDAQLNSQLESISASIDDRKRAITSLVLDYDAAQQTADTVRTQLEHASSQVSHAQATINSIIFEGQVTRDSLLTRTFYWVVAGFLKLAAYLFWILFQVWSRFLYLVGLRNKTS